MEKLLTLEEVAELTRTPLSTLRYWRHRGEGPNTFRLGRRVLARESDIRAWIDERVKAGSAA